jgi:hypothetical protein
MWRTETETDLDEAVVEVQPEQPSGEGGVGGDHLPCDGLDGGLGAGAGLGVEVVGQAGVGLQEPRAGAGH